jgi:hypothetical protein
MLAYCGIEGDQSYGVLLRDKQIRQTGGQANCVIMLGQLLGPRSAVVHRTTLIDDQGGSDIGFIFVLTDIKAIRFAKELPIDRADLITMHVRSVLFEIDAGSDMPRAMDPSSNTFDYIPSKQLQGRDLFDIGGLEPTEQRIRTHVGSRRVENKDGWLYGVKADLSGGNKVAS